MQCSHKLSGLSIFVINFVKTCKFIIKVYLFFGKLFSFIHKVKTLSFNVNIAYFQYYYLKEEKMATHLSDHFTYKKLLKTSILPILMMICISTYGTIDGLFISNFVGDTAFAGLNLIGPATMIIGAIGFMFGAGGSALVSMKLGQGKNDEANKIFSGIVYFVMILGIVISVICYFLMEKIALLLGATPEILPYAVTYGKIFMIGEVAFMIQNLFQTFCSVAEKSWLGFILSLVAGVLNIGLDAIFILVFKWGIAGAAIATIIGQAVSAIIAIIYFSRKNSSLLKLGKPSFKISNILKSITNGSSEFLGNIAAAVVGIAFNFQLLKYAGERGLVSYGILMQVGFIFNSIFIGYSIGTAPIVGYHYGANNVDEIKSVLKKSAVINVLTGISLAVLSVSLAYPFAKLFVGYDNGLVEMATTAMRIYSFSFIIYGLNTFASSFFTALNNGLMSIVSSTSRTLIFQTMSVLLLPLMFGLTGIWVAIIFAEILSLGLNLILLISNRKKYKY